MISHAIVNCLIVHGDVARTRDAIDHQSKCLLFAFGNGLQLRETPLCKVGGAMGRTRFMRKEKKVKKDKVKKVKEGKKKKGSSGSGGKTR